MMTHNMDEIKKQNNKARPKYLLFMLVCMIAGGFIGFFAAFAADHWTSDGLQQMLVRGLQAILLYGIPTAALLTMIPSAVLLHQARQKLSAWDGDSEEEAETIEWKLTCAITLIGIQMPVDFFFFTTGLVYGRHHGTDALIVALETLVVTAISIWMQQKTVDMTRTLNPEKQGSVYDLNFQKKWVNSFDENERRQMGEAAVKSFRATNSVCVLLWLLLTVGHLFLHTGLLPVTVVLVILTVSQGSYLWTCLKISRPAKR